MARTGTQFAKITGNYTNANIYATWQLRSTNTTNKNFKIRLREYLTISGSATYESSSSTFKLNGTTIKSGSYSYSKGDHLLGYKDIDVVALADGSFPNTEISVYAKSFHFPATTKTAILTSDDIPKMELGSSITNITTTFEYPAVGMVEGILINAELLEEYTTKLKATLNGTTYNLLDNVTTPEISVYFDEETYNDNQADDGDDSVLFPLNNLQIAQLIPNDRQINITFTLDTYEGDVKKSTFSKDYIFEVTTASFDVTPTLQNDVNTKTLTGKNNRFIANYSVGTVKPNVTYSNNGATVSEYIFTRINGDSTSTTTTTNDFYEYNNLKLNDNFIITIVDSRGFEQTTEPLVIDNINYIFLDYFVPQFTNVEIGRAEQTADFVNLNLQGSFWNQSFGSVQNAITLKYRFKLSNETDYKPWVTITPTISENSFNYNDSVKNVSADLSATFEIELSDKTGSVDLRTNFTIPKGKSMFDWAEDYFSFNGELCINDEEVPCFQEDSVEDDGSRNVTLYDSRGKKLNVAPSVEGGIVKITLPVDLANLSTAYNYFHPFAYSENDVASEGTKLTYGSITTDYGDRTGATVYGVTVGEGVRYVRVNANIRLLNNHNSALNFATDLGIIRNGELITIGGASETMQPNSRYMSTVSYEQIPVKEGDFLFIFAYKGSKTADIDVISSWEMTNVTFEVTHINGLTVINNNGGGTGSGTTDYEELNNLPRINGVKVIGNKTLEDYGITIPTNVSTLNNDAGYLTSIPSEYVTETELTNKGYITSIPSEYITETELNNKGYLTSFTETDPTVPSHVKNITSANITSWNNKSDFSGSYDDLTNKPTIPTVPTNISAFTNDSGYITADDIPNGIEELTSPIRIWDLTARYYKIPASSTIYYYGSSNTSNSFTVNSASTLMIANYSSYKYYLIVGGSTTNNHLYYGYCSSGTGTYTNLKLNDIKSPTSTLSQYNLGYYSTTSTITNLNSTNYVNPGMYGMSINAGTSVPSEITSGSQAILNVLVSKQKPSGATYIRQDLYVPSKDKHWKRTVYFNGSSYTYPDWEEVVEDLSDYALKTEIPDISSKQDTLVSGTNIKTINGTSLLGSGDITIEGGSSVTELTSNFNVWDLESGIYYVAPNVTMTNYTMFYDSLTSLGVTADTSMSTITVQLAKAFLIVHNYYEGMGMVEFTLFMMGEAPTVISGMTMYQEGIAMGGTIIGGDFMLSNKLQNYQEKLVSGTNIKTINNQSLLGSGNITIESEGGGIETLSGSVTLANLEAGFYSLAPGTNVYYYGQSTTSYFTLSNGGQLAISDSDNSYKAFEIVAVTGSTVYLYLGGVSTMSNYGFYSQLSRTDLANARGCTNANSQKALGYRYDHTATSNLNSAMYFSTNEWSLLVSADTSVPSDITSQTKVHLSTKVPGYDGSGYSATQTPFIRQDLYAPSLNKHWYRTINYTGSSTTIYPEWTEIVENASNGGSGSGSANVTPVTTISSASTHTEIPSAKAVYELFNSIINGDEVSY